MKHKEEEPTVEPKTPYGYQFDGAAKIATFENALLADRMGLGKSAQAVMSADLADARNVVVLCPSIVKIKWLREFERFSVMDLDKFAVCAKKDTLPKHGVIVCTYDMFVDKNILRQMLELNIDLLILDESHALNKTTAKRTRYILTGDPEEEIDPLIQRAKKTIFISGTPMRGYADDLWPMLYSAFPHFITFGKKPLSYWGFVSRFCKVKRSPFGQVVNGNKNVSELKEILDKFMVRRSLEDVKMSLPPLRIFDTPVEAGEVDIGTYFPQLAFEGARTEFTQQDSAVLGVLNTIKGDDDTLAALRAMEKSTPTLRRYYGLAKVDAACKLIIDAIVNQGQDKIVVFAIHKDVINLLHERLHMLRPKIIYGGTAPHKRQKILDNFQSANFPRVLLAQINAAGVAIEMTAANEAIFVESSYVPADNAQAICRLHRNGQKRKVRVRFLSLAGSTDERVQEIVRRKTAAVASVFGDVI